MSLFQGKYLVNNNTKYRGKNDVKVNLRLFLTYVLKFGDSKARYEEIQ